MADNVTADPGSGGATFGSDDIGGVQYPRTKLIHGADGTNDGDVSTANPLPVELTDVNGSAASDITAIKTAVEGTLTVLQAGSVSSNNSTSTPLSGGATFTGTADDLTNYGAIVLFIDSDVDSAANGISIEYSTDGTNWDKKETHTFSAASAPFTHTMIPEARYFRIVYTNGAGAQTHFRLQVLFHTTALGPKSERIDTTIDDSDIAVLNRSVLTAHNGSSYVNIDATTSGNLKASIQEISDGLDVGAGNAGAETQRVSISTDDVNLSAIKTAVETIDNAISGSEMQVDIVADSADLLTNTTHNAAFGTAGSADAQVRTVQGIASMTPLLVDATGQGDLPITLDGEEVTVNLGATDNAVLDSVDASLKNVISTNNSTTSTLAGDATYTGTADDVSGYSTVTINIYADQDSAASGMQFQFSSDGTNWDDVYSFTLDASSSNDRRFQFPVTAQYFRFVYTNGSTPQGAFRVQTILHTQNTLTSIHRVDDVVTTDRSAELVKAVVAAKVAEGLTATGAVDGEYESLSITGWRELRTRDQRQIDLANCNDHTDYAALGDDTANKADSVDHLFGTGAITFDKVDGTANTVFAGVEDTIASIDTSERFEAGSFVGLGVKLPSIADVNYVFLRVGTDSSNYNEWQWEVDNLTAAIWNPLRAPTNQPDTYAGNGWNPSAITYVAFGVAFNAETDTLSGIVFDNVHMVGGRVSDSTTAATISTSVSSPNVKLNGYSGSVDTGAGNLSASGTLRVTIASDDANLSGILADTAAMDTNLATVAGAVSGSEMQVDIVSSALPSGAATAANQSTANTALSAIQTAVEGTLIVDLGANNDVTIDGTALTRLTDIETNTDFGATTGGGTETGALRVTIANDSTGVLSVDDNGGSLTVDSSDLSTLAGAVSGSEIQADIVGALPSGSNTIGDVTVSQITAQASGGCSYFYDNDLDETAVAVKASAGTFYGGYVMNTTANPLYLQLFNTAQGSVTVGTTTPVMQFFVPTAGDTNGSGFALPVPPCGVEFTTAITAACSTDSEGNGAPGTSACQVNFFYE